jgi:hypothetical protein
MVWFGKTILTEFVKRDYMKFSKLHEERCSVIKKLFSDFHVIHRLFYQLYSNTVLEKTDTYSEFRDKYIIDFVRQIDETKLFFDSNKILIEKSLAAEIQRIFDIIYKGLRHSTLAVINNIKNTNDSQIEFSKQIDLMEKVYAEAIPAILENLEKEFRGIYGVK